MMLQQTQTSRVVEFYKRWLKKFPSFSSLARASAGEVLREWSGLGYNNRALRFHRLANIIAERFHSQLPRDPVELQKLPGIGKYTAHAVACFAFRKPVPVVDVNIKRVLTRVSKPVRSSVELLHEQTAWQLAGKFLPERNAYQWNQALMDLGATLCTARNPQCKKCPLKNYCRSAFSPSFSKRIGREKKQEPSWKGIPRRLYRGKILKMLHHHSLDVQNIAVQLWKNHDDKDLEWLNGVLAQMKRDGIVSHNKNIFRIVE